MNNDEILRNLENTAAGIVVFGLIGWLFKRTRWFEHPGLGGDWLLEEEYDGAHGDSGLANQCFDVHIQRETKKVRIGGNVPAHGVNIWLVLVDDAFASERTIAFETLSDDNVKWPRPGRCYRFREQHQNQFVGKFDCPFGRGHGRCWLTRVTRLPNRPIPHLILWILELSIFLAVIFAAWWTVNPKLFPFIPAPPAGPGIAALHCGIILFALASILGIEFAKWHWSGPPRKAAALFGNRLLQALNAALDQHPSKPKKTILKILSQPERYEREGRDFGIRTVRKQDLDWVAEFDQNQYGRDCVSPEGLTHWWKRYRSGVHLAFAPRSKDGPSTREELYSFIGLWPLTADAYKELVSGQLTEEQLGGKKGANIRYSREASAQYWYFADVMVCREGQKADRSLRLLILKTYQHWRSEMPNAVRVHMCAIGSTDDGRKLLEQLGLMMNGNKVPGRSELPIYTVELVLGQEEVPAALKRSSS